MIDSHCHLDLSVFDDDRKQVIERAKRLGLQRCLLPGLSNAQFEMLLSLQNSEPMFDICLGLHPYFLKHQDETHTSQMLTRFNQLAERYKHKIIAIGEAGLDATLEIDFEYQQHILKAQIATAKGLYKPLILHHRHSHNQLIKILKQTKFAYGGVIHAFSGSEQIAKTYIDMGFVLGVGGTITYQRAKKTRQAIKNLDLKHLLLETDSPDMPVFGKQGQRNEPSSLINIIEALADLKSCSKEEVKQQTTQNYYRLFSGESKR